MCRTNSFVKPREAKTGGDVSNFFRCSNATQHSSIHWNLALDTTIDTMDLLFVKIQGQISVVTRKSHDLSNRFHSCQYRKTFYSLKLVRVWKNSTLLSNPENTYLDVIYDHISIVIETLDTMITVLLNRPGEN